MNSLRNSNPFKYDESEPIIFQCLEWLGTNESKREVDNNTKSKNKFSINYKHVIKLYGVTKDGISVSVNNNNFKPYFYIKVDDNFTNIHKMKLMSKIKKLLDDRDQQNLLSLEFVKKKDFYGFTNNKLYKFVKLTFLNSSTMNKTEKIIKEGFPFITKEKTNFKLYESNISPFIRFIHSKELQSAGWVKINPYTYKINNNTDDDKTSTCQIDIDINFDDIEHFEMNSIAPMLLASFDIECDSSHGDFPLAKKNYKKLGCEVYDNYKKQCKDKEFNLTDKKNKILYISSQLNNSFVKTDKLEIDDIHYVFTKNEEIPDKRLVKLVSNNIYTIINRQETYKILILNLLKYFYKEDYDDLKKDRKMYKNRVISMICDSFFEKINNNNREKKLKKTNTKIEDIYTKTNKKPTKKIIESLSSTINTQIILLYNKISKIMIEYECTNSLVNEIIEIYINNETESTQIKSKIIEENYELDFNIIEKITSSISLTINSLFSILNDDLPEIENSRDTYTKRITNIIDQYFPKIEGDKVIQIGTAVQKYGEKDCFMKHIITLNSCDKIDNAVVEAYDTEEEVLLAWTKFIQLLDPDIITGYNIFGFDFAFMYERAEELGIVSEFSKLGRIRYNKYDRENKIYNNIIKESYLENKKLSSSALGDNILKYITMDGRILLDLLKVVQKDHNLVSYKLDYVAENFINDKIKNIDGNELTINGEINLTKNNYITINFGNDAKYLNKKFKIIDKKGNKIYLDKTIDSSIIDKKPKWTLAKDDVTPQDIFRLQKGSSKDRQIVAIYCIQDCVLCINLIDKLKIITNNIGMANVCYVPLSYLFLRGQGVKIFSLVSQQCRKDGYLIPVVKYEKEEIKIGRNEEIDPNKDKFNYGEDIDGESVANNDDGYEGAIVLPPNPGLYLETPITVLDYASLYPSSMISENLCHTSIVDENNEDSKKYLGDDGIKELKKIGYGYEDITYDVFKWINPNIKSKGKEKCGKKTCRFVQPLDGSKSVLPNKLRDLLKARKSTRKKIVYKTIVDNNNKSYSGLMSINEDTYEILSESGEKYNINKNDVKSINDTYNDFEKSVYDGLQLAFKMTANSLYGQLGASTSPISYKDIAASTTATGRRLLYLAKEKTEEKFDGAKIVYGDTDSIFINFNPTDENGNKLINKAGLEKSIEMGVQAEKYIQTFLKPPHKLEYEKTFWPFMLFSKKRYIGNKYEFKTGPNDYKETSMGIVLKRRDNADIVKHVYGGVIDILMNQKNLDLSVNFLQNELKKLLDGKFKMNMLIITKSLRGYYKNPDSIAHKVLADRMGLRDPGNKPSSNDRIPFVYVQVKETKGEKLLQGNRIEHPEFILENNLLPDYMFYITNQIMKPVGQIYSLIVEDLKGFKHTKNYYEEKYNYLCKTMEDKKARKKIDDLKFKDACDIIFGETLRIGINRKQKSREITEFFTIKK